MSVCFSHLACVSSGQFCCVSAHHFLAVISLRVRTSAIHCLKRVISKMTSGTFNFTPLANESHIVPFLAPFPAPLPSSIAMKKNYSQAVVGLPRQSVGDSCRGQDQTVLAASCHKTLLTLVETTVLSTSTATITFGHNTWSCYLIVTPSNIDRCQQFLRCRNRK